MVEIKLYNFITCYFHLALCHKYFLPVIIELFVFNFFKIYLFNLFIFGCVGSSLLCAGFL